MEAVIVTVAVIMSHISTHNSALVDKSMKEILLVVFYLKRAYTEPIG